MMRASGLLILVLLPLAAGFFGPALPSLSHRAAPRQTCVSVLASAKPSSSSSKPSSKKQGGGGQQKQEQAFAPDGGWAPPAHKRKVTNPMAGLEVGQKLSGKVRNVESFGAFVDVGAERDGFVHVKDISHEFVHAATDVLRPGKQVDVYVKFVIPPEEGVTGTKDAKLGLTLLKSSAEGVGLPLERFSDIIGETVEGRILRVTNFGIFMDIGCEVDAFMHCSQLPMRKQHNTRMSLEEMVVGRMMKVRVLSVDEHERRVAVTGRAKGEKAPEERQRFSVPDKIEDVFRRAPRPSA